VSKKQEMSVYIESKNEKMHYHGNADDQTTIDIDYIAPNGDDNGHTPLELLLLSLGSCIAMSVTTMLRNRHKTIESATCHVKGFRRDMQPTNFEVIKVQLDLFSNDLTDKDVQKVMKIAKEKACPVWNMLKNTVEIDVTYTIHQYS